MIILRLELQRDGLFFRLRKHYPKVVRELTARRRFRSARLKLVQT